MKILNVSDENFIKTKFFFKKIGGLRIDIFNQENWKVIYIESRPFIDSDSYPYFQHFFSVLKEDELNFINYPLSIDEKYMFFKKLPSFDLFEEKQDELALRYTGGIAYGRDNRWAIHSDPDNHILFLGFEDKLTEIVREIFAKNEFVISEEKLIEDYSYGK